MKGKSWSSNVGGRVVVSIWNCQRCQMLIGPPAGNELNRLGSGHFIGALAAALKQPEGILPGKPQQAWRWLPEQPQVPARLHSQMPLGLLELHLDQQCQSPERASSPNPANPTAPQAKCYLAAESQTLQEWKIQLKRPYAVLPVMRPHLSSAKTQVLLHRCFKGKEGSLCFPESHSMGAQGSMLQSHMAQRDAQQYCSLLPCAEKEYYQSYKQWCIYSSSQLPTCTPVINSWKN